MPIRLRLFLPVSLIITIAVIIITLFFVNKSINLFYKQMENSLMLEVQTIHKMFDREASLKQENVITNLNVAIAVFESFDFNQGDAEIVTKIKNQQTGNTYQTQLKNWRLNNIDLYDNSVFVDSLQSLFGGTVTVFQKADSGFVRISTNVLDVEGKPAVGTYIPMNSPVSQALKTGEDFYGRAMVVDEWNITAYTPIFYNDSVIGALYVGNSEKDLNELKRVLYDLKIGKTGYPFVFDKHGVLIIHPEREGENWADSTLFRQIQQNQTGFIDYLVDGKQKIMAFDYFEKFELYIAAALFREVETAELKRDTVIGAVVVGVVSILLLLILLYYFTSEKMYRIFTELQRSRKRLGDVSRELANTEERFRKLFDSTGDDIFVTDVNENIVEVNQSACYTLGYSREELISMKITEIKSEKYAPYVDENRKVIYELGAHTFESEHIDRNGQIIQVEFTSRLVNYGQEKYILSVVRNISKRNEAERQILSAVIRGEEKERERFAKEMHDGLGPLLSTIKLYVNELDSVALSEEERKMLINQSNELIDEAVNATRTISNNLMPTIIHSYGLVKAIRTFCDKVNKTNKLSIKFETHDLDQNMDNNLQLILFRVISELINNTIKHAQATEVNILLSKSDGIISLFYKDNGVGFVVNEVIEAENKGMGLKNIISRIKSINGLYTFSSAPGLGFTIKIEINL
jgi:PAS domain S-box-containing protein